MASDPDYNQWMKDNPHLAGDLREAFAAGRRAENAACLAIAIEETKCWSRKHDTSAHFAADVIASHIADRLTDPFPPSPQRTGSSLR